MGRNRHGKKGQCGRKREVRKEKKERNRQGRLKVGEMKKRGVMGRGG